MNVRASSGLVGVVLVVAVALLAAGGGAWWWWASNEPEDFDVTVALHGIDDGDLLNREAVEDGVEAELVAEPPEHFAEAEVTLNGEVLDGPGEDGRVTVDVAELDDGEHTLAITQARDGRIPPVEQAWTFAIDTRVPDLELDDMDVAVGDEPVVVAGRTDPDAEVEVNGEAVDVDEDGAFEAELVGREATEVQAVATSPAGNEARAEAATGWVPSRAEVDEIHGLHVSPHAWAHDGLREDVLEMAEEGRITAVVLSLKDESGHVGWDSDVELANEIGADIGVYDLDETVAELHDLGVRVVGRIVAFADPMLAPHAWEHGDRDMVVQRPEGTMHTGSYAGFTSFAHPEVRQYQIDLALEAARAGVDDILWDYIRRPDGPVDEYYFAGLDEGTTPEESIVEFLEMADEELARYGTGHGVSVYGIASDRPHEIAQDIPGMAQHVDYIAPMVYYSHWNPGEFDVADPWAEPGLITERSLEAFQDLAGDRARVIAWLQDFQLGGPHGEAQVREQLEGAARAGVDEWMMWDPSVRYTRSAYDVLDSGDE